MWSSHEIHGVPVLDLRGELSADTVLELEPEIARLLAGGRPLLVLHLAGVEICDAAAWAMLDACDRASTAAGVELRLAAPTPAVGMVMRSRGLTTRLRVFGSLDGATRGDPLDLL